MQVCVGVKKNDQNNIEIIKFCFPVIGVKSTTKKS